MIQPSNMADQHFFSFTHIFSIKMKAVTFLALLAPAAVVLAQDGKHE